jgi:arsenate reductase
MSTILYHNSRCSKSRCSLDLLQEKNEDIEIVEYLKNPLTVTQISDIVDMLGISPKELIRKGEPDFKEHFKGKELTDQQWLQAMVDYPKLMERPIVVKNGKAAIGRPIEKVIAIL